MSLNLTVTGETAPRGYLTAYTPGDLDPSRPTSTMSGAWHGANHVIVPVSSTNKITLYNCCGSVDLIVDVEGVFRQAGPVGVQVLGLLPGPPEPHARHKGHQPLAVRRAGEAGYAASIQIDFGAQWRNTTAAFAVNVTAVSRSAAGYLTAFSGSTTSPGGPRR